MPLSESDFQIVDALASDASFRDALGLRGPIAKDIIPLLESYVTFLRYAPVAAAEPPPAVWAVAQAHRETGPAYERFRAAHPDLASVAQASLERTAVFFTDVYRETRMACLRGQPGLDLAIWPLAAREFQKSPPLLRPIEIGALVVLVALAVVMAYAGVGLAVAIDAGFATLLLLGLILRSVIRDMRSEIKPDHSTLPIEPDVIRAALIGAASAESQAAHHRRDRKNAQVETGVAGTLGFAATLAAFAAIFDF